MASAEAWPHKALTDKNAYLVGKSHQKWLAKHGYIYGHVTCYPILHKTTFTISHIQMPSK